MSLNVRRAQRKCDYHGGDFVFGEYGGTLLDDQRDICKSCVIELAMLFGIGREDLEPVKEKQNKGPSPSGGFYVA
jgi:hypothetical protein